MSVKLIKCKKCNTQVLGGNRCKLCDSCKRFAHNSNMVKYRKTSSLKNIYRNAKDKAIQRGYKAICEDTKKLCVDHCHDTGKPRSILCDKCNRAEGLLRNSNNAGRMYAYMLLHNPNT